jgi:ubiquitin thioesterase protein OTUB1
MICNIKLWRVSAEYQEGNAVFLLKINGLAAGYDAIRRTRGDGNCFFRSFIFGYIENLVKTDDITERNR